MLIQSGIDFNIPFAVLDPDPAAPCSTLTEFHCGKLTDYNTVMEFGSACDIITIEIENVNTTELKDLVLKGKKVFPQPEVILTENAEDVKQYAHFLPAVNKLGREGYDGRGVQILKTKEDLLKGFNTPGLVEKLIDFEKEISVIVARNQQGDVKTFPVVEMVFHPVQNLVEYLFSPADISPVIAQSADAIARKIIEELKMVGLLAVEMFVTKTGEILVNEIAPRPHNSGHHTIEANITSQYEQHLRAVLNLPLGDTSTVMPSAMVNLLGEPEYSGLARYQGFDEALNMPGVYVHLYGKQLTKPFRKMGHVTILEKDIAILKKKANFVKQTLKVIA